MATDELRPFMWAQRFLDFSKSIRNIRARSDIFQTFAILRKRCAPSVPRGTPRSQSVGRLSSRIDSESIADFVCVHQSQYRTTSCTSRYIQDTGTHTT